jgi:acyl carrier protein
MNSIESKIAEIVAGILRIPSLKLSADEDLIAKHGLDSMQRIEIFIAVEKEFLITIPDQEANSVRSIAEIASLVEKLRTPQ